MARLNPLTAHLTDAGFAPGSDKRVARSEQTDARHRNADREQAMRPPVSRDRSEGLPADFADPAVARVAVHIRAGNWEQAKAAIDGLERDWELWRLESTPLAQLPMPQRLAIHVNRLGLTTLLVELIERQGVYTLGGLVESFPDCFVGVANCGPERVKAIARAMVGARALTPDEANDRLDRWADAELISGRLSPDRRSA